MPKHILSRTIRAGGLEYRADIEVVSGRATEIAETILASAVDRQVAFTADISQLKSLMIMTDRDVVIETNSGSAAANTFNIAANRPFQWIEGDPALRDTGGTVVTDITSLFVTNPDGDAAGPAALKIFAIEDPTV